ncbi:MAG: hypothetical protein IJC89_06060 [Clostridia bacterium]|nr:hypothetical protein [Clostridia bacterium]
MTSKLTTSLIFEKEGFRLDYYILTTETKIEEKALNTYGVKIIQSPLNAFSSIPYMCSHMTDIFCTLNEAEEFCKFLAEGEVEPVHFFDILDEYIA